MIQNTTQVMVVEDQMLVLGAISALLNMEDNYTVIAQCKDGLEAIGYLEQATEAGVGLPDVILTDIEMPNITGLQLAEYSAANHSSIPVVIMTTFARAGYIKRAIDLGVKGFILKEQPTEYLVASIEKIIAGQRVIDAELALSALDSHDPLSEKERKALKLASDGLKTAEIASRLFLSEGTVRNYLSEAIAKLNATNRADAARIARQKGWL